MSEPLPPLVLVVDDSDDNRAMYAEFLAHSGYRVAEAADGRQAVVQARELLPDVVVMDLSLPVMDGRAATRELKDDQRTRGIPVIALTGHTRADHSGDAAEAGYAEFLAKPCLPAALLATVRVILDRTHKRRHG
jgi:CheY-like chemotaxis protein